MRAVLCCKICATLERARLCLSVIHVIRDGGAHGDSNEWHAGGRVCKLRAKCYVLACLILCLILPGGGRDLTPGTPPTRGVLDLYCTYIMIISSCSQLRRARRGPWSEVQWRGSRRGGRRARARGSGPRRPARRGTPGVTGTAGPVPRRARGGARGTA